ncbi:MAG TPA: DMT family transporter [Burkholderiales bacterium]|nr:DMT family transporter [Burkholderiales bacterium]
MEAKLPPRVGIVILLAIATTFGANHVAARVAFDHGASVAAAVSARSAFTALFLLLFLKTQGVPVLLRGETLGRALAVGVLVAMQSYCLYSSVARIPVALALLVFQTCPMLFVLLSWAMGKEAPRLGALAPMPIALLGLAFALDLRPGDLSGFARLAEGVAFAFGAAVAFTLVLYLNAHWLKALDGRVRTFWMMAVTATLVLAGGASAGALTPPADAMGWLGVVLLTLLYGVAITSLFVVLPRLGGASSTVALNFEPIAVLALAWLLLGQAVSALQVLGAFLVVGSIAWLGLAKK